MNEPQASLGVTCVNISSPPATVDFLRRDYHVGLVPIPYTVREYVFLVCHKEIRVSLFMLQFAVYVLIK